MKETPKFLTREIQTEFKRNDQNSRETEVSFSSETPISRGVYAEILDHTQDSIDLSRLSSIGVALFNHDPDKVIGQVTRAWVEAGRGKAVIQFDEGGVADEIFKKVESGTLKGISVGYQVANWEYVEDGERSSDERFVGPAQIAKRWMPYEISVVSIPADAGVGINRSLEKGDENMSKTKESDCIELQQKIVDNSNRTMQPEVKGNEDEIQAVRKAAELERKRAADVLDLCVEFKMDSRKFIESGADLAEVQSAVIEHLRKESAPVSVSLIADENDKYREAMADAMLLRGGVSLNASVEGANEFRRLTIRDMMNDCARREGVRNPERMDPIDLKRAYFTPTSAFPAILDQAINKSYVQGYQTAPTTFDLWTTTGTLTDFKPTKSNYRQGDAGEFLYVPEGGELKHDKIVDTKLPERKLSTYGRQFTLTREAIINDDIGLVTSIPARYAASARRTLNKQVYSVIANNAVIYDGLKLFDPAHKNIVNPGTKPTYDSIQDMIMKLMLMTDESGDPIASMPRYILVPIGMGDIIRQLIGSPTLAIETSNGAITTRNNPLCSRGLEVIEDAYLNTLTSTSGIEWYLLADKSIIPTIQIDYLNGQAMPSIRRMEYPGQLGWVWDIYLDWAVSVIDYRGMIKNLGA